LDRGDGRTVEFRRKTANSFPRANGKPCFMPPERGPAGDGERSMSGSRSARITLLRPPAVASVYAYSVPVVPPLGAAYVAGALEAAGHSVTVIHALGDAPPARHPSPYPLLVAHGLTIPEIVARIPSDTQGLGVSVMFSQQWPHVAAILRAVRAAFPTIPIFVGGEHATATW